VSAVRLRLRRWAIRALSKAHLTVYRVTRGRVLGSVAGMPVLLLTTTGRRSGKAHTTPLTFFRDGTDLVVIASNGGADRPPDWSLNLEHTPRAVVQIGTDRLGVTARQASGPRRERLWVEITATYAGYARYQERTTRRIPVVLLTTEGPLPSGNAGVSISLPAATGEGASP
jgi:deazaflavin-dependent oxidoreductase (nitroreductase family)